MVVREGFSEEVAFELKNWKEPAMERPGRTMSGRQESTYKGLGQWPEWWMLRLESCFRSSLELGRKVGVSRDGSVSCQELILALLLSNCGCTVVKHHLAKM